MGANTQRQGKVFRKGNTLQSHIKPQSDRYNTHDCGGQVGGYGGKQGVANFFDTDTAKVHCDCVEGCFA